MPRKTLAELNANPPKFTPEQRATINARSQDYIDTAAAADEINPQWDDEKLERAAFARDVRRAREATGLTQGLFAQRYHITLSRLKDWEQGRFKPDSVVSAYLTLIRHDPKAVERALTKRGG